MSRKNHHVIWHGPHPANRNVGLRVVEREPGYLYGEEYEVDSANGDGGRGHVLASLPIGHVAAIAIRDLAEKAKKTKAG